MVLNYRKFACFMFLVLLKLVKTPFYDFATFNLVKINRKLCVQFAKNTKIKSKIAPLKSINFHIKSALFANFTNPQMAKQTLLEREIYVRQVIFAHRHHLRLKFRHFLPCEIRHQMPYKRQLKPLRSLNPHLIC